MDGFTFTSEIVKALAWPSAVIGLVFLLRKPIIELVPLMKKLKYKELELEFSQEMQALKSEANDALPEKEKTAYFGYIKFQSTRPCVLFYARSYY